MSNTLPEGLGDRVLVLGYPDDLKSEPLRGWVAAHGWQVVTVVPGGWSGAFRSLRPLGVDVVIASRNDRKLKVLSHLIRTSARFYLHGGHLFSVDYRERVLGRLRQRWLEVQDALTRRLESRPMALGPGNDHRYLRVRVPEGPPGVWARRSVSIVVPVYNRPEPLARTLAGLLHQTYPHALFDVIVADDGSAEDPTPVVEAFGDRLSVRVVRQPDLGYRLAEVRNLGIRAADGDIIISLDCDMIPEARFVEAHARWHHLSDVRCMIIGDRHFVDVGGIGVDAVEESLDSIRALPPAMAPAAIRRPEDPYADWRRVEFARSHDLAHHTLPESLASGGNCSFLRQHALDVGLYDPVFQKWGGEDVEFAYRMRRTGAYLIPEPEALAYHQEHPEAVPRAEDRAATQRLVAERVPSLRGRYEDIVATTPEVSVIGGDSVARAGVECLTLECALLPCIDGARGEYAVVISDGSSLSGAALDTLVAAFRAAPKLALVLGRVGLGPASLAPTPGLPWAFCMRDYHRVRGSLHPEASADEIALALSQVGWRVAVRLP